MLVVVSVLIHVFLRKLTILSFLLLSLLGVDLCFFIVACFRSVKSDAYKHCLACDDLVYDTWSHCLKCHKCVGPNREHTRYGCLDIKWYYRHNILAMFILVLCFAQPINSKMFLDVFLLIDYNYQAGLIKWPPCESLRRAPSTGTG